MDQQEPVVQDVIKALEEQAESKVFTIRLFEDEVEEYDNAIEALVIFENKQILKGIIRIDQVEGQLAVRLQMNYI